MKKIIISATVSLLVITGCSNPPIDDTNPPVDDSNPLIDDTNQSSNNEDLTIYKNPTYNIELSYPKDWTFDANTSDPANIDIHISNPVPVPDGPQCPNKYVGIEVIASIDKSATAPEEGENMDFREFAKKYIACADSMGGLGCIGGNIEDITINNLEGIKGENSGWDGCNGPGYALEQSQNEYMYIYTGFSNPSTEDKLKLENIVNSIKTVE